MRPCFLYWPYQRLDSPAILGRGASWIDNAYDSQMSIFCMHTHWYSMTTISIIHRAWCSHPCVDSGVLTVLLLLVGGFSSAASVGHSSAADRIETQDMDVQYKAGVARPTPASSLGSYPSMYSEQREWPIRKLCITNQGLLTPNHELLSPKEDKRAVEDCVKRRKVK